MPSATVSGPLSLPPPRAFRAALHPEKGRGRNPRLTVRGQPDQAVWRRGWPSPVWVPGHTVRHTSVRGQALSYQLWPAAPEPQSQRG